MTSYFICAGLQGNEIVSKIVQTASKNKAIEAYIKEFNEVPKEIFGPFFNKREKQPRKTPRQKKEKKPKELLKMKFSTSANSCRKAKYNNWIVNAFILSEPKDSAYLVFVKNLENDNLSKKRESIIVNLKELKEI